MTIKDKGKYSPQIGRRVIRIVCNAVLLIFSITCVFPMIWLLYSSFKTQSEFMRSSVALPAQITLENYFAVFQQTNMGAYMVNSARNTILSVTAIIFLSFLVGYVMARFKFWGKKLLYNYFIMGMLIPLHALLVPLYIQFRQSGLINQWYTLLLPYIAFGLSISIMLMESYIVSLPIELEEAAEIEGCGVFERMFRIIFPLSKPIIATVAIIQFFAVWNEFSFALILVNKDELRTVPVGLTMFKAAYTVNYPRLMAGIIITALPVMILYFAFSKKIIEGMTAGAIKG